MPASMMSALGSQFWTASQPSKACLCVRHCLSLNSSPFALFLSGAAVFSLCPLPCPSRVTERQALYSDAVITLCTEALCILNLLAWAFTWSAWRTTHPWQARQEAARCGLKYKSDCLSRDLLVNSKSPLPRGPRPCLCLCYGCQWWDSILQKIINVHATSLRSHG